MATFAWTLQGTSPTTIDISDIIQFAGASFGTAIFIGEYQDSTHVKSSVGANDSSANGPYNSKFLTSSTVSMNGAASAAVSSVSNANCPLKIAFTHGVAVSISDHVIYAYNGSDISIAPTDVTFKIAERGNSAWTQAHGVGSALNVGDHTTPATLHEYYFLISASPVSVGLKQNFRIRTELIYS